MIGRSVGRYRITGKLGEGGMGSVWRADDTLLGRAVALKLLPREHAASSDARRRFVRGARAASRLDHPGICQVYDAGEADGEVFTALACIEGQTLGAIVERSPLPIAEVFRVGIAAAEALGFAHAHGVIHRDVSSRNIMIARDGRVVVLDFGLAIAADLSRISGSDTFVGTIAYMAPEVVCGRAAEARSDLFGLGVVLYEAVTGTRPFEGEREAVLYAVAHQSPEPPSQRRRDTPPALEAIILRLLAKVPRERFASAEKLASALRAAAPNDPMAAPPPAPQYDPVEPGDTSPRRYVAVLPFELAGTEEPTAERRLFVRGLANVLTAALSRFPELHVVPAGPDEGEEPGGDLQAVARRLGANLILKATVRSSGLQLRVAWSLLDPWRGIQVGGETVEGVAADSLGLEERLAISVISSLGLEGTWEIAHRQPRDPAAREHYVQALGYLQRYENEASVDGAIALLERLRNSEAASAEVEATLGRAYLHKYQITLEGRWEAQAAAACERAAGLDPTAAGVAQTLGALYEATGQNARAVESYTRAIELEPSRDDARAGLGRAYLAVGRQAEAEEALRAVVAGRPEYWATHHALGRFLQRVGRYEEARTCFEEVVRLTPDNARAWRNLAVALFHLERYEDALEACRRSVEVRPEARSLSTLGTILFYLGRYSESAVAFERGLALQPADPHMWGNLGCAASFMPGHEHRSRDALQRAVALAREKLTHNPSDARYWSLVGGWLANLEQHGEAAEAIQRSLDLEPANPEFMAHACAVSHQAGDRARALHWLRAALTHGYPKSAFERDPYLSELKVDPEFTRIVEEESKRQGGRNQ